MKIGVLGAGQLGRMLALAGYPLGLSCRFLSREPEPAGQVAEQIVGEYTDPAALDRLASGIDIATYEFENVPVEAARRLAERVPVYPSPEALELAQDRAAEKSLFRELGIPVPEFRTVDSREELSAAAAAVGFPCVLKTRRLGYDGKGQRVLRREADLDGAWAALGKSPLILEAFVPFNRELSVLAVRTRAGDAAFYPLVQNVHCDGILRESRAPAPGLPVSLQQAAEAHARAIMVRLGYVGVLALELFESRGTLLANEMAPRVHNSGHWTIEGAEISQFENHLRAVAGLPLGSTACRGHAAMLNLIGTTPEPRRVLEVPGAHLHLYGKSPRPGRKLGHITIRTDTAQELDAALARLRPLANGV